MAINWRKGAAASAGLLLAVFVLFVFAQAFRTYASEPPFRMVLEPDGTGAIIQFHQPGQGLVSPPFRVDVNQTNEAGRETGSLCPDIAG